MLWGVPVVAQEYQTWLVSKKGTGLIPGLTQWVKFPASQWAAVQVADAAQIWPCCGCGAD